MSKHAWRLLAALTALACGLLITAPTASAAPGWQPAWTEIQTAG